MSQRVTIIQPERKPWQRPRCEAEVTIFTQRWRERSGKDMICERVALYKIGKKKLCKLHAGDELLAITLSAKP